MWRHNFAFLASGALSVVLTQVGCRDASFDKVGRETPSILTVEAIRIASKPEYTYPIVFYGQIHSLRRSTLSFEFAGQVAELMIDEGQDVQAGQPIAKLDTSILQAERSNLQASRAVESSILKRMVNGERDEVIAAARAQVLQMQSESERAIRNRDRLRNLSRENVATKSEYENAYFEVITLQASIDQAKARLDELQAGTRDEDIEAQQLRIDQFDSQIRLLDVRMNKSTIYAPFAAQVTKRYVDEGVVIQSGEPLFDVAQRGNREARFALPIEQLELAQAAREIHVDSNTYRPLQCRVVSTVSTSTRTVDIIYELSNADALIEGQTCEMHLVETIKTKCVQLPLSALVPSIRGLWSCYRLEKDDSPQTYHIVREEVTINHTDGDSVFVETAIPAGSLVVRDGIHKLVPGMIVRLKAEP